MSCVTWPDEWPVYKQSYFSSFDNRCDMLVGPCACGAAHYAGEFDLRGGVLYRFGRPVRKQDVMERSGQVIDLSKKYTCKGCPVTGLVQLGNKLGGWVCDEGRHYSWCWNLDGTHANNNYNLQEVVEPVTVEMWVTVYADGSMRCHKAQRSDSFFKNSRAIACVPVKVTYRPGEGLDQ